MRYRFDVVPGTSRFAIFDSALSNMRAVAFAADAFYAEKIVAALNAPAPAPAPLAPRTLDTAFSHSFTELYQ